MTHLSIFAAGSLAALVRTISEELNAELTIGPAGLLANRIRACRPSEVPDLFFSASLGLVEALAADGFDRTPRPWVRNRLAILALRGGKATVRLAAIQSAGPGNAPAWATLLADDGLVLGTSTPGADPGGDYAKALIESTARFDTMMPERIGAKTKALVGAHIPTGGRAAPAMTVFLEEGAADLFLCYRTTALRANPTRFAVIEIPEADNIEVRTGVLALTENGERASSVFFRPEAVAAAAAFGFEPPAADPASEDRSEPQSDQRTSTTSSKLKRDFGREAFASDGR